MPASSISATYCASSSLSASHSQSLGFCRDLLKTVSKTGLVVCHQQGRRAMESSNGCGAPAARATEPPRHQRRAGAVKRVP